MIKLNEKHCRSDDCLQQNPQPVSEYYSNKNTSDGLQSYCRSCLSKHRRKDWTPKKERGQTAFQKTQQFRDLCMVKTCVGMAQIPLKHVCAELCLQADDFASKETYRQAVSALVLVKQVLNHIQWIMEAGER